jgi:acetylornithine deacetylase/succinyl-diaminopimelate desuccinylase-like protein
VADQDPEEIAQLFTDYVKSLVTDTVTLEMVLHSIGFPAITPTDAPEMKAAAKAYETTWGVSPVFTREGGTLPVVAMIQKELGTPVVLMGFGLDDNIHSPNEHFRVDHFYRGIDTVIHYYHLLSERS